MSHNGYSYLRDPMEEPDYVEYREESTAPGRCTKCGRFYAKIHEYGIAMCTICTYKGAA